MIEVIIRLTSAEKCERPNRNKNIKNNNPCKLLNFLPSRISRWYILSVQLKLIIRTAQHYGAIFYNMKLINSIKIYSICPKKISRKIVKYDSSIT